MFEHIIGVDGLCVYPFCRKPSSKWDLDRAIVASDRYSKCFQSNLSEFEAKRLSLQDAEYDRIDSYRALVPSHTPNLKPSVPPDPPGSGTLHKKTRRFVRNKNRVCATLPASSCNAVVGDLRCTKLLTTQIFDGCISSIVLTPFSDSVTPTLILAPDLDRTSATLSASSCNTLVADLRYSVTPTLNLVPDPFPTPHVHHSHNSYPYF